MGKYLDIDDVSSGHPVAENELLRLRKNSVRYQAIRQDHGGEFLPDIALYSGSALDEYIDAALLAMIDSIENDAA